MNAHEFTAKALRDAIREKKISVTEALTDLFSVIESDEKTEKPIGAYTELYKEEALKNAKKIQARVDNGEEAPLLGVPISLKDNILYEGHALECASKILKGYIASYNAYATERLLEAGAIIPGRLNMDEFAMGSSTETSAVRITRNPHDRDRVPGGSSGGCAASVAAHHAFAALGSDTGGSIRQPASLCGCVGFKPTYGRVSRYGLAAFGSSFDQIGPLTKTVEDAALIMDVIAGYDANDSTSMNIPAERYSAALAPNIKGMKIGLPKEYFLDGMSEDVKNATMKAMDVYASLGACVKEISLPHTKYGINVYYVAATAEASSNLARFDGIRYGRRAENAANLVALYEKSRNEGFGEEVKRRILIGTYVLSSGYYDAYYLKALKARTLIKNDFDEAFKEVDVIACPTTPSTAFKIGERVSDPIQMYLTDIFTTGANLAGVPAISVPSGRDANGMPIGLQVIGKQFDEQTVLNAGYAYERETN